MLRTEIDPREHFWDRCARHLLRKSIFLPLDLRLTPCSPQSYGPLFPFGQYTLLNSLLTSVACYIAIGLIAIAFIFPESINHATLVGFSAVIGKLKAVVDLQQKILESSPDDLARGSKLFTQLGGMRVGIIMQIQQSKIIIAVVNA